MVSSCEESDVGKLVEELVAAKRGCASVSPVGLFLEALPTDIEEKRPGF